MEGQHFEAVVVACTATLTTTLTTSTTLALQAMIKICQHIPEVYSIRILSSIPDDVVRAAAGVGAGEETKRDLAVAALNVMRRKLSSALSKTSSSNGTDVMVEQVLGGIHQALCIASRLCLWIQHILAVEREGGEEEEERRGAAHAVVVSLSCCIKVLTLCCLYTSNNTSSNSNEWVVVREKIDAQWRRVVSTATAITSAPPLSFWEQGMPTTEVATTSGMQFEFSTEELSWLSSNVYNCGIELATVACSGSGSGGTRPSMMHPFGIAVGAAVAALRNAQSEGAVVDVVKRTRAMLDHWSAHGDDEDEENEIAMIRAAAEVLVAVARQAEAWDAFTRYQGLLAVVSSIVDLQIGYGLRLRKKQKRKRVAQPVTVVVQARCASSDRVVYDVCRAELMAWSSNLSRSSTTTTTTAPDLYLTDSFTDLARQLLTFQYPAPTFPLEHVRTLIFINSLGLLHLATCTTSSGDGNDKKGSTSASTLGALATAHLTPMLGSKGQSTHAARTLFLLVSAQQVLSDALVLIEKEMRYQATLRRHHRHRLETDPALVHTEDTPGGGGGKGTHMNANANAWKEVVDKGCRVIADGVALVVEQCQHTIDREDGEALGMVMRELAVMMSLHGKFEEEEQARGVASALGGEGVAKKNTVLECMFPTVSDVDVDVDAGVVVVDPSTTAEELESMSLGDGSRMHAPTVLAADDVVHRSQLCIAAALKYDEVPGSAVSALYCAAEAHRLLASLVRPRHDETEGESDSNERGMQPRAISSWWRLAASYCKAVGVGARLFESAGMMDEAMHALKEGQNMAQSMGSALLDAFFTSHIAMVWCRYGSVTSGGGGSNTAAEVAVAAARAALLSLPSSASQHPGVVRQQQCIQARISCVEGWLCLSSGLRTQALLHCHEAIECATGGALAPKDRVPLVAEAHLIRSRALREEEEQQQVEGPRRKKKKKEEEEGEDWKNAVREGVHAVFQDDDDGGTARVVGSSGGGMLALLLAEQYEANVAMEAETDACAKLIMPRLWTSNVQLFGGSHQATTAMLWKALALSRGCPHVHRRIACALAPVCAAMGHLSLAALLLHMSQACTLQMQHRLVLHARQRAARTKQQQNSDGSGKNGEVEELEAMMEMLDCGMDWDVVQELGKDEGGSDRCDSAHVLKRLDVAANKLLARWVLSLPSRTSVCSVSHRTLSYKVVEKEGEDSTADAMTMTRTRTQECLVLCRLSLASSSSVSEACILAPPIILDIPIQSYEAGCSTAHPIRSLRAFNDGDGESNSTESQGGAVASVVEEMHRILDQSTHSMKVMPTDTKEQQRAWWKVRVELDDALASLLHYMDGQWLGPWHFMMLGTPVSGRGVVESVWREKARGVMAEWCGDKPSDDENDNDACRVELMALLLEHVACLNSAQEEDGGEAVDEPSVRQIVATIVGGSGNDEVSVVKRVLEECNRKKEEKEVEEEQPLPATVNVRRGPRRRVKFVDDDDDEEEDANEGANEASPPQTLRRAVQSSSSVRFAVDENIAIAGVARGDNLCARFDAAVSLHTTATTTTTDVSTTAVPQTPGGGGGGGGGGNGGGLPARTPGAATLRAKKHRSRLAMMLPSNTTAMQTPAKPQLQLQPPALASAVGMPSTTTTNARKGGGMGLGATQRMAATVPRPARPLETPAVAKTVPAAHHPHRHPHRPLSSSPPRHPVVVIFSPELQSLPWESAPSFISHRIYRIPCLPGAATTALTRRGSDPDLHTHPQTSDDVAHINASCTYYVINPSGDLQSTQDTFETWFQGIKGWEGQVGVPAPTPAQLASALQSRELFVYCGHGGGEQYIPPGRLRSLRRCASSLLMGCSSGRLKTTTATTNAMMPYYEPTGVVLAYLLAGCPTAVANLWDVTDRDIDRFAQALLTKWLTAAAAAKTDRSDGSIDRDVAVSVGMARNACKLRNLIGAAPVCYGLPASFIVS